MPIPGALSQPGCADSPVLAAVDGMAVVVRWRGPITHHHLHHHEHHQRASYDDGEDAECAGLHAEGDEQDDGGGDGDEAMAVVQVLNEMTSSVTLIMRLGVGPG